MPPTPNPAVELAKERNRAAQERTLMAWIRTSLSLISFGFGLDRIVAILRDGLEISQTPLRLSRILGLSFVALGTAAMLYAAMDHRRQLRRIQQDDLVYVSRRSPSFMVSIVLAVLGVLAFVGILLNPLFGGI
jgi:putative membrane protein